MLLTMSHRTLCCILAGGGFIVLSAESPAQSQPTVNLTPSSMPKIATVDPRYLSYNIEMVEVTGGRFWKPYNSGGGANDAATPNPLKDSNAQVGDIIRPLSISPANQLERRATSQTGRGTGTGLRPREWHVGKQHLFSERRQPCLRTAAGGIQNRSYTRGVEGRD